MTSASTESVLDAGETASQHLHGVRMRFEIAQRRQKYFKEVLRFQWCPSVCNEQNHIPGTYLRPYGVSAAIIAGCETSETLPCCVGMGDVRTKMYDTRSAQRATRNS
jgi:hypothetical protein